MDKLVNSPRKTPEPAVGRVRLAIRELVEFILRSGDIDSRYAPRDRMAEGARIHRALQKRNRERCESYNSEVRLSAEFQRLDVTYILEGRADGIFLDGGKTVVDEIKTTALPLELIDESFSRTHWAQAQCYACIYALQNGLPEISVRLTYVSSETGAEKLGLRTFNTAELESFVGELLEKYTAWADFTVGWRACRDLSIGALAFPFPEYRRGQRELAVRAYRAILAGRKLFAQAPHRDRQNALGALPGGEGNGRGENLENLLSDGEDDHAAGGGGGSRQAENGRAQAENADAHRQGENLLPGGNGLPAGGLPLREGVFRQGKRRGLRRHHKL